MYYADLEQMAVTEDDQTRYRSLINSNRQNIARNIRDTA